MTVKEESLTRVRMASAVTLFDLGDSLLDFILDSEVIIRSWLGTGAQDTNAWGGGNSGIEVESTDQILDKVRLIYKAKAPCRYTKGIQCNKTMSVGLLPQTW